MAQFIQPPNTIGAPGVPQQSDARETVSLSNPFDDPLPVARHSTNGAVPPSAPLGPGMAYAPPPYHHSMFSHHATNNAPPIHYCDGCRREIKDDEQGIQCTAAGQGCNNWFHQECSGLTPDAFAMIQNEPLADWVCSTCNNSKSIEYVRGNP
uniref:PHD-type domain-containing protein n=1 Tax=Plectus sambesii TaxID=2011161 RepID=A0A914WFP6_9BILA